MADGKAARFYSIVDGAFSYPGSSLGLPPSVSTRDGSAAAGQAETAKISRVGGAATQALSPVGPRLSALIARDELEKLTAGRIVFDSSGQMRAGVKEKVEARLADNLDEDFARSLKEIGMANGEEIMSASSVRAALVGDGFEVKASSDGREAVRGGAFTPWTWDDSSFRPTARRRI
jgi:hypothetical protein